MSVWSVTLVSRNRRGQIRRRRVARFDSLIHGGSAPWRWLDYQTVPAEAPRAY